MSPSPPPPPPPTPSQKKLYQPLQINQSFHEPQLEERKRLYYTFSNFYKVI